MHWIKPSKRWKIPLTVIHLSCFTFILSHGRVDVAVVSVPGHVPVVCRGVHLVPGSGAGVSLRGSPSLQPLVLSQQNLAVCGGNINSHLGHI